MIKKVIPISVLIISLLLSCFKAFGMSEELMQKVKEGILSKEEESSFNKALSLLRAEENLSLVKAVQDIRFPSVKLGLSWLFLIEKDETYRMKFNDLSALYFKVPYLPKREAFLKKIKYYVQTADDPSEIEEIIWFYITLENANLMKYLAKNRLSVKAFIDIVKIRGGYELLRSVIFTLEEEISDMLWEGRTVEALPLIISLPEGWQREIFLARIYFQTKNRNFRTYAENLVEKEDFHDDGFLYDYIKYLKKTEHYKTALSLLFRVKNYNPSALIKLAPVIEELFRHYIDTAQYDKAYEVISRVKVNPETQSAYYIRAEFLAGFTAMKFLGKYNAALKHFQNIYELKNGNYYTKSRGAYFIARTYELMKKKSSRKKWLLEAAKYPSTFYGIRAIEDLNDIHPVTLLGKGAFTEDHIREAILRRNEIHKFYFDDLIARYYSENLYLEEEIINLLKQNTNFKIGFLMLLEDKTDAANSFFSVSVADMTEKEMKLGFDFLNTYIKAAKIQNASIITNTFASRAANYGVLIAESYPIIEFVLNNPKLSRNALIHGIIKQESNFVLRAISGAGAMGLMQVMPATGRMTSRGAGLEFNVSRLKSDYKYNIQIGSFYLDYLLKKFDYIYPFALAGYNAGPNRILTWQKRYFYPKDKDEMVDFIELIPIRETREYVMRVMENEVFYNYLLENHRAPDSIIMLYSKDSSFQSFKPSFSGTKGKNGLHKVYTGAGKTSKGKN